MGRREGRRRGAVAPAWQIAPGVSDPPRPTSLAPAPPTGGPLPGQALARVPALFAHPTAPPPPPPTPPTAPPERPVGNAGPLRPHVPGPPAGGPVRPQMVLPPPVSVGAPAPVTPLHEGRRLLGPGGADVWMPGATAPALPAPARYEARASVDEQEGSAFAARFAAEFLSWDEDNPSLRTEVLRHLLRDPRGATLGWSGAGRQRAELVLVGRTLRTPGGALVVEVTVRVQSFQRVRPRPAPQPLAAPADPERSCCPPAASADWVAGASSWARVAPPVVRDETGELKVDLGLPPTGYGS
ncbi:MAG: hypothetical protein AB7N73_12450 [Gemmatimonadales bacterium]